MNFEIISWKKHGLKKMMRYLYFIVLVVGINAMIKGFGGSESWFKSHDFPVWAYILNILLMFIVAIMGMANVFSGIPVVGKFSVDGGSLVVKKNGQISKLSKEDLLEFKILQNFKQGRIAGNLRTYSICIRTRNMNHEFEIKATQEYSEKLRQQLVT